MNKSYERQSDSPRTLKGDLERINNKHPHLKKILAGTAIATSLLFAGNKIVEANAAPEFTEITVTDQETGEEVSEVETTTYIVEPGDGLQVVVGNIDGIDSIDWRDAADYVRNMPENESVFENGQLDPGEIVTIPTSVER